STEDHSGYLKVALFDNPTNLDPRTYSDVASYRVIEQIYDFLVKLDSTGRPQPVLATGWETPSDTTYIFHIRDNVYFHDGSKLSAHDAAFTYRSILDPSLKSPQRLLLQVIDKISVPDSFTLKIKLKEPFAPFLSTLEVGIVPEKIARKNPQQLQRNPLGSGPFRFDEWKSDAYILLPANKNYWNGAPRIDGLEIKILPEATTRILALENGEIDFLMNNFPESMISRFRENPALRVKMETGSNYVYLGLNLANPYLSHRKVRQAIAYAIDVRSIIKNLMEGIHEPARSLLNPEHWAYNPDLPDYPYNPDKARRLLDEAGFPDPDGDGPEMRFNLTYKTTDKQMSRQKAQIIQQYLKEVGIGIDIQSYEWGTFFDDIQNGRFDMYSLTWVGVYEPDLYYRLFHSASIANGANRGGYRNEQVDSLIEQAQHTTDLEKRKQYYYRIQEILARDLPYISLWYETNVAVMNKKLRNFSIYPAAEWISFRNVYFEKS
ncbi:MAG: ABC transporter substrate-binding protein, partial [Calditrichia bacterium]